MEDSEKMAALKRAYADIILNMAKEAAARILMSERKALCLQQDLFAAKEDALNSLLRLKRVMDSKISEAEQVSLDQKRRIEELEAQLNEAEDIVKSLRQQLDKVQNELGEMKQSQHVVEGQSKLNMLGSDNTHTPSDQRATDDNRCIDIDIRTTQSKPEFDNPDLASLIMRSKEPELLRNGCTQRIRALEQNLLHGKLLQRCGQLCGTYRKEMNDTGMEGDVDAGQPCKISVPRDENMIYPAENLLELRKADSDKGQVLKCFRRLSNRRRRGQSKYVKASTQEENSVEQGIEESQEKVSSSPDGFKAFEDSTPPHLSVSADDQNPHSVDHDKPVELSKIGLSSVCGMKDETVPVENGNVRDDKICEVNGKQSANDGFLKYTFRRKRKRVLLSSHQDETTVEKKSRSKRKDGDRPSSLSEPKNPNLVIESSRDSRRLVQVARQLISLSEKQWW